MVSFAPTRFAAIAGLALSATLPAQSPQTTRPHLDAGLIDPPRDRTYRARAAPYSAHSVATPGLHEPGNLCGRQACHLRRQRQPQPDSSPNRHRTGMKITGGVTDERVFGQYGPAPPIRFWPNCSTAPAATWSSCIATAPHPTELVLTPRQGGATPPNPNAAAFDDRSDQQRAPQAEQPPSNPGGQPVFPATSLGAPAGASQPNGQPNSNPAAQTNAQPTPRSPTLPTESRLRSRSTSNSNACASSSNSSSSPPSLNSLIQKRGSPLGRPSQIGQNLTLGHLGRHHAPRSLLSRHLFAHASGTP